jgi:hypothetical protein
MQDLIRSLMRVMTSVSAAIAGVMLLKSRRCSAALADSGVRFGMAPLSSLHKALGAINAFSL